MTRAAAQIDAESIDDFIAQKGFQGIEKCDQP